jgi:molecular chaperone DnaJ
MRDPYSVLGISPGADPLTVRRAYQKMARRWHPGLRAGDSEAEEQFQAAARAYALLSDPEQRRHWDEERTAPAAPRRGLRARRRGSIVTPDLAYSFEELVVELLPDEAALPPERGSRPSLDIRSEVELDFDEAIQGIVVSLSVQRESICSACDGAASSCPRCEGRGFEVGLERVRVRIPAGVDDGSRVRVPAQGNARGEERGDLFVTIRVRPHGHFRRQGLDVLTEVPVTVAEAALGAEIDIQTIRGSVTVQLPAGTRSGQRFRLAGRGVARSGRQSGDHYYRIQIVAPEPSIGDNRRLLEALEQANPRRREGRDPAHGADLD